MQTKRFIDDSENNDNNQSNPSQPPLGPAPLALPGSSAISEESAVSELLAECEELLMQIARLQLVVYSLPPAEQIVLRALHGLDCDTFTPEEVAERMEISVAQVFEIESRAIARVRTFYLGEAA